VLSWENMNKIETELNKKHIGGIATRVLEAIIGFFLTFAGIFNLLVATGIINLKNSTPKSMSLISILFLIVGVTFLNRSYYYFKFRKLR
jgi:uncharacterized membrane protein HdeD (DUF308 family)